LTLTARHLLTGLLLLLPVQALAQAVSGQYPAENYRIRAEYRWFSSEIVGNAANGAGEVPGTEFDIKDDLAVQDDRTWDARGTIRLGARFKLRGAYTALDYKGQVVLDRRIRYDDTTFESGEDVATSIKGGYYGGELEWDLVIHPKGYLGFFGGARVPDVDVVISSPDRGKRELATYRPVVPVVGAAGRVYAGRLSLEGFASTFARIEGRKITEFEVSARIHISDRLALSGGYRYISFEAEAGADFADFAISGWTYGLELGL
jgi:hypothetical protein